MCRSKASVRRSTCRRCAPVTRERVSARAGVNGSPAFSPDGRCSRYAVARTRQPRHLSRSTFDAGADASSRPTPRSTPRPTWSPDGRSIYFISDRAGGPQIYRVGAEPGARRARDASTAFTTRGRGCRRTASRSPWCTARTTPIGSASSTSPSGVLEILTHGPLDESPSFAPNGAQIIYATRENGRGVLASVSATDGRISADRVRRRRRARTRVGTVPAAMTSDALQYSMTICFT